MVEGQVVGPVGSVMASHPKKDAAANTHRRTAAHTQKTKASKNVCTKEAKPPADLKCTPDRSTQQVRRGGILSYK